MPSYPTAVYSPSLKSNGQTIQAAHINDPEAEITAIEGGLKNGLQHALTVATGGLTVSSGGVTVTGRSSVTGALIVNHSTQQGVGQHLQVKGESPSLELFDTVSGGSWYIGVASTETANLWIGAGYSPSTVNASPFIKVASSGGATDVTFPGNVTIAGNTLFAGTVTFVGGFASQARCMLASEGGTALAADTWTSLTWDTEIYDVGAMHSTSSNPTKVTIPAGSSGVYDVGAIFTVNQNSLRNVIALRFLKNSTTDMGNAARTERSSSETVTVYLSYPAVLDAADTVEAQAFSRGSTGSIPSAVGSPLTRSQFWLTKRV